MARVTRVYAIFPSAVGGKTWRFWCDCIESQRLGPDWTIKKGLVECTLWQINTQFDARMFPWHLISIKLRNLSLRSCFRYTNVHSAPDSQKKVGIAEKKKSREMTHVIDINLFYLSNANYFPQQKQLSCRLPAALLWFRGFPDLHTDIEHHKSAS